MDSVSLAAMTAAMLIDPVEIKRREANNKFAELFGLCADTEYPAKTQNERGLFGADYMGGIYSPAGNSNTADYLKYMTGVSRAQLTGFENVSDKRIVDAYNVQQSFANELYVHENGWVSNVKTSEADVSVGEIRQKIADLTGQINSIDGLAMPLMKPNGLNDTTMPERQKEAIEAVFESFR